MNKNDFDQEIDEIERHAWRVWLEDGDAIICRRCDNPFVPSGRRRGRDDGESVAGGNDRAVDEHDNGRERVDNDREMYGQAVNLCGSCLPLRSLDVGDRSTRYAECEYCGGPIRGRRGDSKYCSDSCKTLACRKRKQGNQEPARDNDRTEDSGEDIGSSIIRKQSTLEEGST